MSEQALDISQVLIGGDLSRLTPEQKTAYYLRLCDSLKLNPYSKPFGYIRFNDGKEQLYPLKNCTEQLREIHRVSIVSLERQRDADMVTVIASGKLPDGRTDFALGAVSIKGLSGEPLANAMMKAETKAKRRLTLAMCGLGWVDESEIETVPGAQVIEGPALPAAPEGEVYVPTREREVEDAGPDRIITSADDKAWKSWERIRDEAMRYRVRSIPAVGLPLGYQLLVSTAREVKEATEARKAMLASQEAARSVWTENRRLMDKAYAAGLKLRDLPSSASEDEVLQRNDEIRLALEQQTA